MVVVQRTGIGRLCMYINQGLQPYLDTHECLIWNVHKMMAIPMNKNYGHLHDS